MQNKVDEDIQWTGDYNWLKRGKKRNQNFDPEGCLRKGLMFVDWFYFISGWG